VSACISVMSRSVPLASTPCALSASANRATKEQGCQTSLGSARWEASLAFVTQGTRLQDA
jgi:hypothetical protein